jgi:hypothetical protein
MDQVPPPSFQSNYPRGPQGALPYQRLPGVYFDTIGIASRMVQANYGVYMVSTLMMLVVTYGLVVAVTMVGLGSGLLLGAHPFNPVMLLLQIVQAFVLSFLMLGLICIGVKHARGEYIQISDFFQPFKNLAPTAGAVALASLPQLVFIIGSSLAQAATRSRVGLGVPIAIEAIALIAGILFYLLLMAPLMMAATHSAMTGTTAIESLQTTFRRLGPRWPLLGLVSTLANIVAGLGVLLCCIGILLTYPIGTNVIALHYTYFFPTEYPPAGAETSL